MDENASGFCTKENVIPRQAREMDVPTQIAVVSHHPLGGGEFAGVSVRVWEASDGHEPV